MIKHINGRIATSIVVFGPCCGTRRGKSWRNAVLVYYKHVMKRKRKQTQTLNFLSVFSCSNVLVRFFASCVRPLFGAHHQNGACKFPCPYIFVASSQLTVFTSSRLVVNSLKTSRLPPVCLVLAGGTAVSTGFTPAQILGHPVFSSHPYLTYSFTRDQLTHNCLSLSHSGRLPVPQTLYQPFFLIFLLFLSLSLSLSP